MSLTLPPPRPVKPDFKKLNNPPSPLKMLSKILKLLNNG